MREHEIEVQVRLKTLDNVADKLREYLEVETAPDDLLERGEKTEDECNKEGEVDDEPLSPTPRTLTHQSMYDYTHVSAAQDQPTDHVPQDLMNILSSEASPPSLHQPAQSLELR